MQKSRSKVRDSYDLYGQWQAVVHPGAEWFDRNAALLLPRPDLPIWNRDSVIRRQLTAWIEQHCQYHEWHMVGVTKYSYRFYFLEPEMATLFRIANGI